MTATPPPTVGDLVVVSLEAWDNVWRRNQYLIDGILRSDPAARVLYVEPARDLLYEARTGRGLSRDRGLRVLADYAERLTLFQPTKVLPRVLGPAADASWRRQVLREVKRLEMHHPLLWVNDAQGAQIVARNDSPALYDITDDWLVAERSPRSLHRLARNESTLLKRCQEVVVCSSDLQTSRGAHRPVRLIPNAVDVARYQHPAARPSDLPARAALYAGTLHEDRLDVDLLTRCAAALGGEAVVVLLGPDALPSSQGDALRAAGVLTLGRRPHDQVAAYLQHADVLIVPHLINRFTNSLDPIKLYEYRAAGRPIVSTAVAGFRDSTAPTISIVTAEDFPAAVLSAVRDVQPTIEDPDVPDWSQRVAEMTGVLRSLRAVPRQAGQKRQRGPVRRPLGDVTPGESPRPSRFGA